MKRLPGYDRSTSRSEWAAFGCLGAVAVAAIFLSLPNASKFAEERNDVITAWSLARTAEPTEISHRTNGIFTKATHIPTGAPAELRFLFRDCSPHNGCTPCSIVTTIGRWASSPQPSHPEEEREKLRYN